MRYRHMMVQQSVRMHNKTAGLLMESGVSFHKTKLHGKKYFADLIKSLEEVPESVKDLLRMSHGTKDMFEGVQKQLLRRLLADAALKQRVERLSSIDGVGAITRSDLGAGGRRPASFCLHCRCGELLRFDSGIPLLCGQAAAWAPVQAAQQLAADHADRSSQAGATLESAAGSTARSAARTRARQSRHLAGGAQAGRLSASRRQERPAFSGAYTAAKNKPNKEKSQKTSCFRGLVAGSCLFWVCSVSGLPAGPHACQDCARELTLPIHPIVCFEVGWFTLTQSSWTALHRSRKWMSGHAATALAMRTIEDSSEPHPANRLGKAIPPSQRKSPFSLDGYLSWMSRIVPSPGHTVIRCQLFAVFRFADNPLRTRYERFDLSAQETGPTSHPRRGRTVRTDTTDNLCSVPNRGACCRESRTSASSQVHELAILPVTLLEKSGYT